MVVEQEGIAIKLASWNLTHDRLPLRLLITGLPGSGKTALLKKLKLDLALAGVVLYETDNADESASYWKDKTRGKNVPVHVISMKYTDGCGLNIGPMLATEADRQRFAWKLVPEVKGDTAPFWNNAARLAIENAAFILWLLSGGTMMLADIIRVASNQPLHSALCPLAGQPDFYAAYGNNDSKRDVSVTAITKLKPLAIFAATDLRCAERITLPLTQGILVIEIPDTFVNSMSGITAFIFDTLGDHYLSRQSSTPVAFLIDEFRELGALDCIDKIGRRGRKASVSLVLTMHEVQGVYDRYGQDRGEELLGLMDHKLFLRAGSPSTAKWASSYLGETEVLQEVRPNSTDGSNKTISRSVTMRPNVLPDELRRLPMPNYAKDTLTGWADFPDETTKFTCTFKDAVTLSKPPAPRQLRPDSHQVLPRLDAADLRRLGVKYTPEILALL